MVEFGHALRRLREALAADMGARGITREKVLATVVNLLDRTLIRVGNAEHAKGNDSYGLTTLQNKHVGLEGSELHFRFKGKSGKEWRLSISDRRIARIVRQVQDLPGQDLFQYLDAENCVRDVASADVNASTAIWKAAPAPCPKKPKAAKAFRRRSRPCCVVWKKPCTPGADTCAHTHASLA